MRTASSGTASGTAPGMPWTPSLWPCGPTEAGLRRPSKCSPVMSNSGPRSSSEPVKNGRPTSGFAATGPVLVWRPQKQTRVQRMSNGKLLPSRRPALRQAASMCRASIRPDGVRPGRPGVVEPGRHVALVAVAVDVEHLLAAGHAALLAHLVLEHLHRRGVVVLVVVRERGLGDRAVVGEVRPAADRHPLAPPASAAAHELVHAQHVDARVDRVARAVGVLGRAPLAVLARDPVVGQVGLDAAVAGQPSQLPGAPAGHGGAQVTVGPDDRLGDLLDQERVELAVGRGRVEQPDDGGRVLGGAAARAPRC